MGIGVIIFGIKYHDPPKFISEYPFTLHAGYWLCVISSALAIVSGFMYMFAYVLRR